MVKKMKKDPMVNNKNGVSANGDTKLMSFSGCGCGGVRDFRVRFAIMSMARIMKAHTLMAHAKPISAIRRGSMIG